MAKRYILVEMDDAILTVPPNKAEWIKAELGVDRATDVTDLIEIERAMTAEGVMSTGLWADVLK